VDELKALETTAEGGGLSEEERERKRQLCRAWRELSYKKKSAEDRNPELSGLRRVTNAQNFFS
jgi:hypothetical protein